jgi:CRISPR/Cas system-associated exonuclease Cas4 (RecB family)
MRKHRDYPDNGYPSVTQVLSELRKIGLEQWMMKNTAQFCQQEMKKGKEVGTDIHNAIEHYILTNELKVETAYPEEVTNALNSFVLFKKEHPAIALNTSEMAMTSEIYKFNGTMDIVGTIEGRPLIGDWKNSTAKDREKPEIYSEYLTQLAAYRMLYAETHKELIDEGFIAVFAKDKVAYNYRHIQKQELEDHFNEVFLPALKITNFKRRKKDK